MDYINKHTHNKSTKEAAGIILCKLFGKFTLFFLIKLFAARGCVFSMQPSQEIVHGAACTKGDWIILLNWIRWAHGGYIFDLKINCDSDCDGVSAAPYLYRVRLSTNCAKHSWYMCSLCFYGWLPQRSLQNIPRGLFCLEHNPESTTPETILLKYIRIVLGSNT